MKKITSIILLAILLTYCGTTTEPNTNLNRPTNLTTECNYVQEVSLTWDYDNGVVDGFIIQRKAEGGVYTIIDTTESATSAYTDPDLISGTTYYYQVAAFCTECQGDWSDEKSIFIKEGFQSMNFGTETTLEVVTWNIEHFPKNSSVTVEYIIQIMRGVGADIYALQEIESNTYFENIIETLNIDDPENTWEGYRTSTASYSVNLAYIYKTNVIQINDIYEIYNNNYNRPFPRHPLVMELQWNGNNVYIINNHLKASGDGYLNLSDEWDEETRRFDACNLLDEYISENLPDENVIVLGDMNDELTDSQSNNVFVAFLNEIDEYYFVDMDIADGPSVYWSYPSWPSHLDHILITNELFDEFNLGNSDIQTLRIDDILDGGWSEYDDNISDHRPVGLKLAIQ